MKKRDWILAGGILGIALAIMLWNKIFPSEEGSRVVVEVDGSPYQSYSLKEDGEYRIETRWGYNVLIIQDGMADISEADCPDEICVRERKISREGETLVCLPHKLVATVRGQAEAPEVDAVVH